jgi:TPR repeat protein
MIPVIGSLAVIIALSAGGYLIWTQKKEAESEALRVEQARLTEVRRQEEVVREKQVELERQLQVQAELRSKAETARREAIALAAAEAEARRAAEAQARQSKERGSIGRLKSEPMSGGYTTASMAARRGDNTGAVSACQQSAQQGNAPCQYLIGYLYATGRVGTRSEADYRLAADFLGKAANQGLPAAQFNFGVMNERGLGLPRDVNTAIGWYRKAASQGDPNARQALAKLSVN